MERARAAGLLAATYFAPELLRWDEGEEVSERVLEKMATAPTRKACSRRRDSGALDSRERVADPRRSRDREAGQPRCDGAHGGRCRRRRAARRRRERRPVEPERDSRVDRRRLHLAVVEVTRDDVAALRTRRSLRCVDARTIATPRPTTPATDRVPRRRGRRRARRRWQALADERVAIPMKRNGGGLAECECRRRCAALRSRAPARRIAQPHSIT